MIQTEDGITTPSDSDSVKLVQDLAGMAVSIQEALNTRANTYTGTSGQRVQFLDQAKEGQLWKDTNGTKALWSKQGSGWTRIWPSDGYNLTLGSSTQDTSGHGGHFQIRRYYPNSGDHTHTNMFMSNESRGTGFQMAVWKNGARTSGLYLRHNGQLSLEAMHQGSLVMRHLPFSIHSGRVLMTPTGTNQTTSQTVSFGNNRFTDTPDVFVTPNTAFPERIDVSISNVSKDSVTLNMFRTTQVNTTLNWVAIQRLAPPSP